MRRRHHDQHSETAAMLAAVASESLPYTDPKASYPTAVAYRTSRRDPTPKAATQRVDDDGDQM